MSSHLAFGEGKNRSVEYKAVGAHTYTVSTAMTLEQGCVCFTITACVHMGEPQLKCSKAAFG